MSITTLCGLAGTDVESKLAWDSVSAAIVILLSLESSCFDFLGSRFYKNM
jgi:hypothetical protein